LLGAGTTELGRWLLTARPTVLSWARSCLRGSVSHQTEREKNDWSTGRDKVSSRYYWVEHQISGNKMRGQHAPHNREGTRPKSGWLTAGAANLLMNERTETNPRTGSLRRLKQRWGNKSIKKERASGGEDTRKIKEPKSAVC
jgi:hypothetical protein